MSLTGEDTTKLEQVSTPWTYTSNNTVVTSVEKKRLSTVSLTLSTSLSQTLWSRLSNSRGLGTTSFLLLLPFSHLSAFSVTACLCLCRVSLSDFSLSLFSVYALKRDLDLSFHLSLVLTTLPVCLYASLSICTYTLSPLFFILSPSLPLSLSSPLLSSPLLSLSSPSPVPLPLSLERTISWKRPLSLWNLSFRNDGYLPHEKSKDCLCIPSSFVPLHLSFSLVWIFLLLSMCQNWNNCYLRLTIPFDPASSGNFQLCEKTYKEQVCLHG